MEKERDTIRSLSLKKCLLLTCTKHLSLTSQVMHFSGPYCSHAHVYFASPREKEARLLLQRSSVIRNGRSERGLWAVNKVKN